MLKTELHDCDANGDPVPSFATDAEIKIAEQLRHRIEEQRLDTSLAPSPVPARPGENH